MSQHAAGGGGPVPYRPVVKHADAVPRSPVAAGRSAWSQVLVGEGDGAPHFSLRRFVMGEGGGMPLHVNAVEHEQYVLRGRARVRVGETAHEVSADDVLLIPAGTPHSYEVLEAPFEFLCAVPNLPDRIRMVDPEESGAPAAGPGGTADEP